MTRTLPFPFEFESEDEEARDFVFAVDFAGEVFFADVDFLAGAFFFVVLAASVFSFSSAAFLKGEILITPNNF